MTIFLTEESNVKEIRTSNVDQNSFYLTMLYNKEKAFYSPNPTVKVNGERVKWCEDSNSEKVCLSDFYQGKSFAHVKLNNLSPDSDAKVEWLDTWMSKFSIEEASVVTSAQTKKLDEKVPTLERIYGKVIDNDEAGVEGSLVYIQNDIEGLGDLSAVTGENGTYSISYIPVSGENFSQKINVLADTGEEKTYSTHNFYNKPVANIVLDINRNKRGNILGSSSFVQPVSAANSCISGTSMGGIRAQCNQSIAWTETLSTSDCPVSEHRFRLGVIKHTDITQFHKPESIKLKLYDSEAEAYVQDPPTNSDLVVNNGGYVDTEKIELENGKTYDIRAFDGTTECYNSDGPYPSVTIGAADQPGSGSGTPPGGNPGGDNDSPGGSPGGSTGTSTIPPMSDSVNLCKKIGENFAVPYAIPGDKLSQASGMRMRWGLGLITSGDQIYEYGKSVSDGNNMGLNMILRICYKGSCDINSGTQYGNKIVEIYDYLAQQGTLPQNGLFILAGHNEPNVAEYRDPQEEAQFVADVIKTVEAAGILSQDVDDGQVKLIAPSMDLYRSENGNWPGSADDPTPHPLYTAQSYIEEMLQNSDFAANVDKLVGWGVNDYIDARAGGPDKVVSDVSNFTSAFLVPKQLPELVFVTELGNYGPEPSYTPSFPWSDLANTVAELEAMENVYAILLFNSLGTNGDTAFSYHQELWNDPSLTESLYSNCVAGAYSVPQEGSVPVRVERPSTSGGNGAPSTSGSVGVNGTYSGSGAGMPGGSFNGTDPCLGGICYGNQYTDYAVAEGGLLNGNFEGEYVLDNDIHQQLSVPQYWHAWYQNKCQAGKCGMYECAEPAEAICRRPEYRKSEGFGNRIYAGDGSVVYFTNYGTHHAGLYQHIELGQGGSNTIDFSASASSWSNSKHCDNFGKESCVEADGCICSEPINTFKGRIGVDPTGGIDPNAGSVVWTEWKDLPNVQPDQGSAFTQFSLTGVESESNRITVFLASNNQYPYGNSDSYWDAAELKVNGQLAIGQANSDPQNGEYQTGDNNQQCDSSSQSGPNGDACWVGEEPNASLATPQGMGGTSNVLGSVSSRVTLPEKGEYKISSEAFDFEDIYISNFNSAPLTVPVFQDLNGNSIHDDDEFYVPSTSVLKVEKVDDVMLLDLKPGLSIIAMPLYTEDFDTAVKLVEEISSQGGYVTSVATYRNIGEQPGWSVYNQRGSQSYSEDFEFRPGDALYVVVQEGVSLRMRGDQFASPVQAYLKQGWNLISIKGSDTQYDSRGLLEGINALPGVRARIVSVWNTDRGRFSTYLQDESGEEYGEVVPLIEGIGVFVYIDQGLGYWIP